VQWQDIENVMDTIEKPTGGFTLAHRGTVTLTDGTKVFVKVGIDEETRRWAQKEIAVYMFLQKHNYPYIPKLLTHNNDQTGFALEALNSKEGWDWTETWDELRLQATLGAMDILATILPSDEEKKLFGAKGITRDTDGWHTLQTSIGKQAILQDKLRTNGHEDLIGKIDIPVMAKQSAEYVFQDNAVVHQDVRADNAAWSASQQTVRLIDWNWTQIGDRDIDINAMLVHVHRSGLGVLEHHAAYLDANALEWLAGFWLNASTNPLRANSTRNKHLRDYQLESGITALELAKEVRT
jgi:hypothetical protein